MTAPPVLNLRGHLHVPATHAGLDDGSIVYIGRATYRGGWRLPGSPWANPYGQRYGEPARRVELYILGHPLVPLAVTPPPLAELGELAGRLLACWCAPGPCHGDVLVEMLRKGLP